MEYTDIELTEKFEGCKLKAYRDSAGVLTIGYGHTKGVREGDVISQAKAEAFLMADIQSAVHDIQRLIKCPLTQGQFNALVDFDFNLGAANLVSSTLLEVLNEGDYQAAANEFHRWNHAGGKVLAGLTARREAEVQEFNS